MANSCPFICFISLCFFPFLFNLLCLTYPFSLNGCSSSYLWVCSPWVKFHMCLVKVLVVGTCLCSGEWSWIFSFWCAVAHLVVCFGVCTGLVWLWAACMVMDRFMFVFYWGFHMGHLALDFLALVLRWEPLGGLLHQLMFHGAKSSLMVAVLDACLPPQRSFGPDCLNGGKTPQAVKLRRQNPKKNGENNS